MMKITVKNKHGKNREIWIDDQDFDRVSAHDWYLIGNYVCTNMKINEKWRTVYLHRWLINAPGALQVDHIDRDTTNNTRANLRLVSIMQNQWNRKVNYNSKTGFKGVSIARNRKKCAVGFKAQIRVHGKTISLGVFSNAKDAARVYDQKALELRGPFARTNEMMGLLKKKK